MKNTENYLLRNDIKSIIREAIEVLFNIHESSSNISGYLFYRVFVLNRCSDIDMKMALIDQLRNILQRGGWKEEPLNNNETNGVSFSRYFQKVTIKINKISSSEIEINFEI